MRRHTIEQIVIDKVMLALTDEASVEVRARLANIGWQAMSDLVCGEGVAVGVSDNEEIQHGLRGFESIVLERGSDVDKIKQ